MHEKYDILMKKIKVTTGGQISLPAEVRRRWATDSLVIEDRGDRVVVRPMPDDPVRAARGSLKVRGRATTSSARARTRKEEVSSEARKHRR